MGLFSSNTNIKFPVNYKYKKNSKKPLLTRLTSNKKFLLFAVVLSFGALGSYLVFRSHAAVQMNGNEGEVILLQNPTRVYDTRSSDTKQPVGTNRSRAVPITGVSAVPAGSRAVIVNVTVVSPKSDGSVNLNSAAGYNNGSHASQFYIKKGQTIANEIVVPLGIDGKIYVSNKAGSAHFVFDVIGYISSDIGQDGLRYRTMNSNRIYDTRSKSPVGNRGTLQVPIFNKGGIPATAKALSVNVTAVSPATAGHAKVWAGGSPEPTSSRINFAAGKNIANEMIVPIGGDGNIQLKNFAGNTHYVFDVTGYFEEDTDNYEQSQEGRYQSLSNLQKVYDTRNANGKRPAGPLGGNSTLTFGIGDKVPSNASAVRLSISAVSPTSNGYTKVWSYGEKPNTSLLNFSTATNASNEITVTLGPDKNINIWNSNGSAHYVVELAGYYVDEASTVRFSNSAYLIGDSWLGSGSPDYQGVRKIEFDYTVEKLPLGTQSEVYFTSSTHIQEQGRELVFDQDYFSSGGIGFYHNSDGSATIAPYCWGMTGGCVALHTSMTSVEQAYADGSIVRQFSMPYVFNEGTTYTIFQEVATDEPGYPGSWITYSLGVDGIKTPIYKLQLSISGVTSSLRPEIGINNHGDTRCKGTTGHYWKLSRLLTDDRPMNLVGSGWLEPSIKNYQWQQSYMPCPGVSRINYLVSNSNTAGDVLLVQNGLPKEERDDDKPTIESVEVSGKNVIISASDDTLISAMWVYDAANEAITLRRDTSNEAIVGIPAYDSVTLGSSVSHSYHGADFSQYPIQQFSGTKTLVVTVVDNSGNMKSEQHEVVFP